MTAKIAKLTTNWKHTSAKAFMYYIRNDSKAPRSSFPDPRNDNKPTCDFKRIEQIFVEEWSKVYNRGDDEPAPDWNLFLQKYGEFIGRINGISGEPLTAQELHAQARRMSNKSAKGHDGWYPREFRLRQHEMPGPANKWLKSFSLTSGTIHLPT